MLPFPQDVLGNRETADQPAVAGHHGLRGQRDADLPGRAGRAAQPAGVEHARRGGPGAAADREARGRADAAEASGPGVPLAWATLPRSSSR